MNIIQKPVPNFAKGRGQYKPQIIVIHIGEGSQNIIYQTFLNEEKSSHYCVSKTGEIWQFVKEEDTAWGNGIVVRPTSPYVLSMPSVNPSAYSISIEHEGFGTVDFTEAQYSATAALVADIAKRWSIPLDRVHILRHNEIRADKTCPGLANVTRIIQMALAINAPIPAPAPIVVDCAPKIAEAVKQANNGLIQKIIAFLQSLLQK